MGDLRDQLKKARILSDKDAKRLAHEERVKRTQVGRAGIEQEAAARELELAAARESQRQQDREREARREVDRLARLERAACVALIAAEARRPSGGGAPWHFELQDGRLPHLKLTDADVRALTAGRLCVVRLQDGDALLFGLLDATHAPRIQAALPHRLTPHARPGRK